MNITMQSNDSRVDLEYDVRFDYEDGTVFITIETEDGDEVLTLVTEERVSSEFFDIVIPGMIDAKKRDAQPRSGMKKPTGKKKKG